MSECLCVYYRTCIISVAIIHTQTRISYYVERECWLLALVTGLYCSRMAPGWIHARSSRTILTEGLWRVCESPSLHTHTHKYIKAHAHTEDSARTHTHTHTQNTPREWSCDYSETTIVEHCSSSLLRGVYQRAPPPPTYTHTYYTDPLALL